MLSLQRALSNRHGLRGLDGVAGERTDTHPPLSTTAWAIQREEDDGHELQSERFAGESTLKACFDDKARLRPGDSGEPVRRLQEALIAVGLGDDLGPKGADGIYGAMTAATVRRFKRVQKLGFEQFGDAAPGPTPPGPTPPPSGITVIPCPAGLCQIATSATHDCGAGDDLLSGDFVGGAKRLSLKNEVIRTQFFANKSEPALEAAFRAAIISGLAPGQDMVTIFMAGAGGTSRNPNGSALSTLVVISPSFQKAASGTKTEIDTQFKTQAATGVITCGGLRASDPSINFPFTELQLKTLIGGTQGRDVFIKGFAVPPGGRTYNAVLVFVICDDFGVDASDLDSAIGLSMFSFWELQHARRGHLPFINEGTVDVPITGSS